MALYVLCFKKTYFKRILSPAPTVSILDCSTTVYETKQLEPLNEMSECVGIVRYLEEVFVMYGNFLGRTEENSNLKTLARY